jgi:hypothetical protein
MAFVVDMDMKSYVLDFKAVDERISILRIKTKFNNLSFINVHAPTEERMIQKRKPFDRKWKKHIALCLFNDTKLLLGGVNAKIGREEVYRGLIRRYSLRVNTNYNGERLVDFAAAKNVVVSSTR